VHFLYFVTQLRLFLRVVILVIWAHSSPRKQDILHRVFLLNGSDPEGGQSFQKLDFISTHVTQPSILISY